MSGPRLRAIVAGTSALISLVVPQTNAAHDTDTAPDPLQYLLASCDVAVPPEVVTGLRDMAQYQDIHGATATSVLAAHIHYTADNPYERGDTPGS